LKTYVFQQWPAPSLSSSVHFRSFTERQLGPHSAAKEKAQTDRGQVEPAGRRKQSDTRNAERHLPYGITQCHRRREPPDTIEGTPP